MSPTLISFLTLVLIVIVVLAYRYRGILFFGPSGPTPRELFVANAGSNSVTVLGIDGNNAIQPIPLRRIKGNFLTGENSCQLQAPLDIAVDSGGTSFVLNQNIADDGSILPDPISGLLLPAIVIFPAGTDGDVAPEGVYDAAVVGPAVPGAITLRRNPASLLISFASINGLHFGMAEIPKFPNLPSRNGVLSGFPGPIAGLLVDTGGFVYGTQPLSDSVVIIENYAPTTTVVRHPTRTISGPHTLLSQPQRLAVAANGDIYVTNRGNASITIYASDADGDAPPLRRIGGPGAQLTSLNQPTGIALTADGTIFVGDANSVLVFAADANGDAPPLQVINGDDVNGLNQVTGLAFHTPPQ